MGFIPPEEGLKVLEFGGVEKLYDEMQQDVRQAQRENLRMQEPDPQVMMAALQAQQTGQPVEPGVPVNSWDTHPVHITTHNKFRKSAAFEQLDDAVKQEFEAHVQQHQAIIAQQYAQQMQMGGAPGAAPGGPPPATPDPSQGQPTPEGQG
jgi:hypothetical protein